MTRSTAAAPVNSTFARVVSKWVLLGIVLPGPPITEKRIFSAARPWCVGMTWRKGKRCWTASRNVYHEGLPAYDSSPCWTAAHWSRLIAPVPESVRRSTSTSSAWRLKRLYPAAAIARDRSSRVVIRIGSTEWIRNGSMIVCQPSTSTEDTPGGGALAAPPSGSPCPTRPCARCPGTLSRAADLPAARDLPLPDLPRPPRTLLGRARRVQPRRRRERPCDMKTRLAALLSLAVVVSGCGSAGSGGSTGGDIALARADVARAPASPADAAAAGAAISAFGLDLYRAVAAGKTNVVLSPTSIALALAMARAGARGTTAAEMDEVMLAMAADDHAGWLNALDQALATRSGSFKDDSGQDLPVALRIANAPFAQRGLALEPAYLEALASRYGAGLRLVDYVGATEAARKQVNGWVDAQTEHRIPELLAPGILTPDTRLTLVNAIYLKAPWLTAFPDGATSTASFTRADGSTVQVPTMATTAAMRYATGTGWQAVEIPYIGGSLAMTVIVPDDLATFEAALGADRLTAITGALADAQVSVTLPKFSIETKAELADVLAALGMPSAFDDRADFSGITAAERLQISNVVHQANIDVDEKGTEAAAATAVVMRETAAPAEPLTVRVDRPFLFAVRDVPTGAVLFLGRVADPSITR